MNYVKYRWIIAFSLHNRKIEVLLWLFFNIAKNSITVHKWQVFEYGLRLLNTDVKLITMFDIDCSLILQFLVKQHGRMARPAVLR